MKKNTKHLLMLLALLLLVMLATSAVTAQEGAPPESVDQLDAAQIAKSMNHDSVMSYLNEGHTARLIIKLSTPFEFSGMAGLEGDAEAAMMAQIDGVQNTFMVNHPAVTEGIVTFEYSPKVSVWVDSEAEYAALLADPNVVVLQQDIPVPVNENDVAPPAMAQAVPWVDADLAHSLGYDGSGYVVAILDTGVDKNHYYLDSGKVVSEACYSTTNSGQDSASLCPGGAASSTASGSALPYGTGVCDSGDCDHGTHVAGIAAGTHTGFSGIAPDADVLAIQVFSAFTDNNYTYCAGSGYFDGTCALTWNTDQELGLERVYALRSTYDIASANMSIGGGTKQTSYCDGDSRKGVIDNLASAGIATVISAGNNSWRDGVSTPGCISTAYTIGATEDVSDSVGSFSNAHNTIMDMWAPGVDIVSSIPTASGPGSDPTSSYNGTSMAAPMVAGGFAVMMEAYPSDSLSQIWTRMDNAGVSVTDDRSSGTATAPRLDFTNAFAAEPGVPVHLTPERNSITLDATPQFQWEEAANADKYTFEIKKVSDNSLVTRNTYTASARCSAGTCTIPAPLTLTNGIEYKWHVVAYNGTNKGVWSGWWVFKVGANTLTPASLRSPGNGNAVYGGRPTFKWYEVTGATSYYVQMLESDSSTIIGTWDMDDACGTYCEFRLPRAYNLDDQYGTYYWRIQAKNFATGQMSGWSTKRPFVYTKVGTTSLNSPANGASTSDHRPEFGWDQATGATKYIVQVRDNVSDDILVHQLFSDDTDCTAGACLGEITPYLEAGEYKWHVRGKNGTNYGNWTPYRTLTVTGTDVVWNYDFTSSSSGWVDVSGYWYLYLSDYYSVDANSACSYTYNCFPTYHNYRLTNATMETSLRSWGTNGGDGFTIYAYVKFNGTTLTQAVELDFYDEGGDLKMDVWLYENGSWSNPLTNINHGTIDMSSLHTYKIVLDTTAATELTLYIDGANKGGTSLMGFHEGSFGFDLINYNKTAHYLDVDSAVITVAGTGSAYPAPLPDDYFPEGTSDYSAFGLDENGERIVDPDQPGQQIYWIYPEE